MIKELLEVYSNWRFWTFILIAFMPVVAGIISCGYLKIKEKIDEVLQRR